MTDETRLERRYQRLLAFYPKAFRREHEREILSVLISGASDGQRRPRLIEATDLIRNAIFMRLRHTRVPSSWEHRHARLMLPVRVLIGTWLLFLTAILYGYGRGGWWGLLLLPAAALHFYIAYRLRHALRSSSR
ncbi:MAG: hypothetical protein M3Y09_05620 [Actinomycetota bacterium]|nr:hypothetical protein [Actinomycetota bacterium]